MTVVDTLSQGTPLFAALFGAFVAGISADRAWWRWGRRAFVRKRSYNGRSYVPSKTSAPKIAGSKPTFDAAEQLRIVERATFRPRPLLNRGEARLLRVLDDACAAESDGWRVMAQVSLGEILASPDGEAYRAINSKRVDLLLVDAEANPRHAIELQGSGHHLGPAATRDAIKKEALRRAGIGYAEVLPGDTPAEIRSLIVKLTRRSAVPES